MSKLKEFGLVKVYVDFNNKTIGNIRAKSLEVDSRGLLVSIVKDGLRVNVEDLDLRLYWKPEDGKVYEVLSSKIVDNSIEFIYPPNLLNAGIVNAEFRLFSGGGNIASKTFEINVEDAILSGDIINGTDEKDLLLKLLDAVKNEEQRELNEQKREQLYNQIKNDLESGALNGEKGDTGKQGPPGPQGPPGDGGSFSKEGLLGSHSSKLDITNYTNNESRQLSVSEQSSVSGNYSSVNSSSQSSVSSLFGQINSSYGSNITSGTFSQINSSQSCTAKNTRSQVNSSSGSNNLGNTSQINTSLYSNLSSYCSQINSSKHVVNNVDYTTVWGYRESNIGDPSSANIKVRIESKTGNINNSGVVTSGHNFMDFAELFPNLTGTAQGYGLLQTVDGYGVRPANEGEQVIGVTSATAGVILGETPFTWQARWLKDEWGAYIYEYVLDESWEPNIELGETENDRPLIKALKENPDWDPDLEHSKRQDRPDEWSVVGLLGQVYVRLDETVNQMDYVKAGKNGIGTKSNEETNLRVMSITKEFSDVDGYKIGFCLLK